MRGACPQHVVPVLPLACRQVADEEEVLPADLPGKGLDLIGKGPPAGIVVGRDYKARPCPIFSMAERMSAG